MKYQRTNFRNNRNSSTEIITIMIEMGPTLRQCIVLDVGRLVLDIESGERLFRIGSCLQIGRFLSIPEKDEEVQ